MRLIDGCIGRLKNVEEIINAREAATLFIAQFIKHRIDRFDEGRSDSGTYRQRQRRC